MIVTANQVTEIRRRLGDHHIVIVLLDRSVQRSEGDGVTYCP